jgi:hypothetical protein
VKPAAAPNIGQQHKLLVGYILPYIASEGKLELNQSVAQLRQVFFVDNRGNGALPLQPQLIRLGKGRPLGEGDARRN